MMEYIQYLAKFDDKNVSANISLRYTIKVNATSRGNVWDTQGMTRFV